MTNANPSVDPANEDSLTGVFREILKKNTQDIHGMLPATVIAFDRSTNRVMVQPAIKLVGTNGEQISRGQVASVPVVRFGGGGFGISCNLKSGDTGWLFAADRDISIFLQSGKESSPQTFRMKNFADSIFIPDKLINLSIASEDLENFVIQNEDATVKISLSTDTVKIAAPNIIIEGNMEFTGDLHVIGNITATGNITPNVPP